MAVDDLGNQKVDFVWGNFPIQPNTQRWNDERPLLAAEDSHSIVLSGWNNYPEVATGANYMITGLEYLGGVTYEFTSQNNLKVGDIVRVSKLDFWGDFNLTVTYADANRFQFEDEKGTPPKFTGLYGRADRLTSNTGRTLTVDEGEPAFITPAIGLSGTNWIAESMLSNVIKELKACGVSDQYLRPATFSGGDAWYDLQNSTFNEDGCIFYYYTSPTSTFGYDANGKPIYGTDMNDVVLYSNRGANQLIPTNNGWDNIVLTVFQSHTPGLNTADWL